MDEPFARRRPRHPPAAPEPVPRSAEAAQEDRSSSSPTTSRRRPSSATGSPCSPKGGVLEQYDTPAEILGRPATAVRGRLRGGRSRRPAPGRGQDRGRGSGRTPGRRPDGDHGRGPIGRRDGSEARTAVVVDDSGRLIGLGVARSRDATARSAPTSRSSPPRCPLGTTLRAALGEMLQHDVRWIPVVDDADRYLGRPHPQPAPRRHATFGRGHRRRVLTRRDHHGERSSAWHCGSASSPR